MNVLIVAYTVDKNDISESQMAYEWVSRLSEHAKLWVVTTGSRLHNTCGLEDNPNVSLVKLEPTVSFRRFDSFDRAVHPGYIEFYFRAKAAIREILNRESIDLCHHLTPQSPRFPSPLQSFRTPYIIGPIHGGMQPPIVMKELSGKEDKFFLLRKLDHLRNRWDILLRRTYSNASVTVASAPYMLTTTPATYCKESRIIPGTAVPLPAEYQSHEGETESMVRFVYAGRLVPSKGVELIIEALAISQAKNCIVSIFGRGGLEEFYRKLAIEYGVEDRIRWEGFVPQDQILRELQTSDVFLFPSLKEPTGGAVLEAMAAGLPVICADIGGPGYAVTADTGAKIAMGNKRQMAKSFADAIDHMAADHNARRVKGRNARKRIHDEFTWEAVVGKMLRLYQELT